MVIRDLGAAEKVLARYRPAVKELLGKHITLDRVMPLMAALDNPHKKLKVVHVAGTSGKTSTAHYIAKMLQLTGSRTGMTASPHVDTLLERIQINDARITESDFCDLLAEVIDKISDVEPQPTYYELLVAMAYYYFAKQDVDFAVIETGLGGLLDATNVANNPDKLCIITDIGLDHTQILGDTIAEIAAQKAGIIHPGNTVVMYKQSRDVMEVFRRQCHDVSARLHEVQPELVNDFSFPETMPLYQRRNWTLAWSAYQIMANVHQLPIIDQKLLEPSRSVVIPGRMERLTYQGQTLVLDGAHNAQKMTAFVESFQKLYPNQKPCVLLSVRDRKDFTDLVSTLFPLASKLILTSFHVSQDIEHQNAHLEDMREFCQSHGFDAVITEPNQHDAFKALIEDRTEVKVITGSFYLLQQLKEQERL